MQTISVELFSIGELSEQARQKAIEKERSNCNVDLTYTVEYAEEVLEVLGFESPKISYSGFGSQGDGLSFVSDNWQYKKHLLARITEFTLDKSILDCAKNLLELSKKSGYKLQFSVSSISLRYCHANTVIVENSSQSDFILTDTQEDVLTDVKNSLCRAFYKWLENEYDYQTSNEYIIDSLLANDVLFLESGKVWSV